MNRTPLADQESRDRICNDLDTTLVVEAAAGFQEEHANRRIEGQPVDKRAA